jgi:galactose mutarotase-like enzyme
MAERPRAHLHAFKGEGAVTLSASGMAVTMLPATGMLGVSLRYEGEEYLDLRNGLPAFVEGHTIGLPLLHPWANRLSAAAYEVDGLRVDLAGLDLPTDQHGAPIHGTLLGAHEWSPTAIGTTHAAAYFSARFRYGLGAPRLYAAFPFPHDIDVEVAVDGALSVVTTIRATGDRPVPVSFGWHPWFRIPRARRDKLRVWLPARQHVFLDDRGIPTGETEVEPAGHVALAGTSLDDHYVLGFGRMAIESSKRRLVVDVDDNFPFAQVYAPTGDNVVCLEPMTARVDALGAGAAPLLQPGDQYQAHFTVSIEAR